jgi:hypothetical protein
MRIAEPINPATLDPAPEPERHQRFDDFPPQKFYREVISEFQWKYHWAEPYGDGVEGNIGRLGNPNVSFSIAALVKPFLVRSCHIPSACRSGLADVTARGSCFSSRLARGHLMMG